MNEEWRPVPGFPDYAASNAGQIKRVKVDARDHRITGRPLKWAITKSGYAHVSLSRDCVSRSVRVNRAVCAAFHGPPPSDTHHAAHNDGKRLNNAADNLRWVDAKGNEQDKRRHGTAAIGDKHWSKLRHECRPRGTGHGLAKLTEDAVRAIRADTRFQRDIARAHGVSQRAVWMVKKGLTWRHVA